MTSDRDKSAGEALPESRSTVYSIVTSSFKEVTLTSTARPLNCVTPLPLLLASNSAATSSPSLRINCTKARDAPPPSSGPGRSWGVLPDSALLLGIFEEGHYCMKETDSPLRTKEPVYIPSHSPRPSHWTPIVSSTPFQSPATVICPIFGYGTTSIDVNCYAPGNEPNGLFTNFPTDVSFSFICAE